MTEVPDYDARTMSDNAGAEDASDKVEQVARAIYELDPFEYGGEYVDSFQVSPGGQLTWEQACAQDSEFADSKMMIPITKFAWDAARAAIKAMK
jgi:hypothetical protein